MIAGMAAVAPASGLDSRRWSAVMNRSATDRLATRALPAIAALAMSCAGAARAAEPAATNVIRNPTGGYTHRTVEIPPGSRILYVSGQTATDDKGYTPPDAATQAEIVYQRILRSLADAGMGPQDLVKTTVYLVDPADIGALVRAGQKYNPGGRQAGTLVYVKALALPEVRVEIEAVAARLP
jgi:enamine deaminase RidA (YjgF/YER057c/UK114 family)